MWPLRHAHTRKHPVFSTGHAAARTAQRTNARTQALWKQFENRRSDGHSKVELAARQLAGWSSSETSLLHLKQTRYPARDRKHVAHLIVTAPKHQSEGPKKGIHAADL